MLFHYLKSGFRVFKKQRLPSLINLVGLSLAVGCCFVVFSLFDLSYNADNSHPNRDRIFVGLRILDNNGTAEHWADSPEPLGPALKNEQSIVENTCRLNNRQAIVRTGEQVFSERVTFMDASVFEMFAFPMKYGASKRFGLPNSLIISEETAVKFFGQQNPVGQTLRLRFDVQGQTRDLVLEIQAVAQKQPYNNTFDFGLLLPYLLLPRPEGQTDGDWRELADVTFVQLRSEADLPRLNAAANRLVAAYNAAQKGLTAQAFDFLPLRGIAATSQQMRNTTLSSIHPAILVMMGMIGLFLLALVCFNYVNLAVATAAERLKEISVRKVLGGSRRQLAVQFLAENALLCGLAMAVGLLLGKTFLLPKFNVMMTTNFEVNFSRPEAWWFCAGLFALVTFASAGYPALYVAAFQPIAILRNKVRLGGGGKLRRSLVGFQFALTFLTLVASVAFLRENQHLQRMDWGYRPEDVLVVRLGDSSQFFPLKNALSQVPGVLSVAGSTHLPSVGYEPALAEAEGKKVQAKQLDFGAGTLETLGVPLQQGETFSSEILPGQIPSVWVNAVFCQQMGWEKTAGKTLKINGVDYKVAGGTGDFRVNFFDRAIPPVLVAQAPPAQFRYLALRVAPGQLKQVEAAVQSQWKGLFPDELFDSFQQQSVFDRTFNQLSSIGAVLAFTSFLTMLIAMFGLFGMSMLALSRRMKEFSVRRVLGANAWDVAVAINREFVVLLVVALAVAVPLSVWLVEAMVGQMSDAPLSVRLVPPVVSGCCILAAMVLALSVQYFRVMRTNPVQSLRSD